MTSSTQQTAEWERAYLRFETSAEEERKFTRRFLALGAQRWPRDTLILDLFSGRGGGARALRALGFTRVVSVDLSPTLLRYRSDASDCVIADCRTLPIRVGTVDVAVVQGGLHHLPAMPVDLLIALREVSRVLRPNGIFVAVEPFKTPFLRLVHQVCKSDIARRMHRKLDALAAMIELERSTYEAWLTRGPDVLAALDKYFVAQYRRVRFGKLFYVGTPQAR
jgi:SAM-dependent methyltransferase